MHRHRDHHHHHHHHPHEHDHSDHDHDHAHDAAHAGPGHNHVQPPRAVAQWQTPHKPQGEERAAGEPDLDKVEAAFVESFLASSDAASFLRLARIPFEMQAADGRRLQLLRVEIEALTDVGSLTPHLGGESFRYDPLPAGLVSQRRRLRFIYFDGSALRPLSFSEIRGS